MMSPLGVFSVNQEATMRRLIVLLCLLVIKFSPDTNCKDTPTYRSSFINLGAAATEYSPLSLLLQ